MYNQIYAMDNQRLKLREQSISTSNGRRYFYFQDQVECAWYLLPQHPYRDHTVYGPNRTVDPQGDLVYSEMNSADWCCET
jgi:hypothetical protein